MARLLLLTSLSDDDLSRVKAAFPSETNIEVLRDLTALEAAEITPDTSLLSFGTGVIVPAQILNALRKPAYNIHAATPDFPGRDPHHHAVYRRSTVYGATVHIMTEAVDAGPIVAVQRFRVKEGASPAELLAGASEAGLQLIDSLGARLLSEEPMPALEAERWGPTKTRRSDLEALCRISPLIGAEELSHRFRSFDGGSYDNLTVELHGHIFRIDKATPRLAKPTERFNDFTESAYRSILQTLTRYGYAFATFGGKEASERHVILRHDVDFSMHRALRMAEIEAEEGASAIYFINPRNIFYNILEPEIDELTRRVVGAGHEVGLHFDSEAYGITEWRRDELEHAIARERLLLETVLERPISAVSWHNPDLSNLLEFDDEVIGGLANAYGRSLREEYTYCSDSNGYWRFKPMMDVIAEGHDKLHLLTHPEWWTPEPMAPSDRIDRAIMGRARASRANYDAGLARGGRKNVTR